jgi:hypothetical protein
MTNSKMKPHHDMGGDQAGPITPDRPGDRNICQTMAQARFGD